VTSLASRANRVSKPRKPGDPDRWPEPCGRCGEHHQIAATWPDARICGYRYQAAKRIAGTCACGHQGILPGRVGDRPACRRCSGVRLNLDCASCGAEAELHSGGRCWTCVLGATVDQLLTSPRTGAIDAALQPAAAALKSMTRANSGLTWINQRHVKAFLAELAARPALTDELATITLGATAIALPPPLDGPLRQLAGTPTHSRTSAHPDSPWIFRGNRPGQHITAGHLRERLTQLFSARAARLGTLHELTKIAPIPIIAEVLGYAPATIERHAIGSASTYSQYVAVLREPTS
jgi:hypothetical protein